ncbi:unnamed protein product [Parnassius apollo]|uniref:(apollo) hypothetical protein n=1 Tax=Parnassius apollo TaxID=110799 RepID=A0A8S3WZM2_PARAO|nr:unnamed protein product [Parnassius apollo]
MELIPEKLLKTICCSCETGCNSLKCGCRKHDEIADEEPMQTENNVGDEGDDGLEDVEDLLESERPVESNDQEIPSKRQKLINK